MIWLKIIQSSQVEGVFPFAGKNPEKFHKRYFLLGVNTTDFEKHTIQAHSALLGLVPDVRHEEPVLGDDPRVVRHLRHARGMAAVLHTGVAEWKQSQSSVAILVYSLYCPSLSHSTDLMCATRWL